MGLPALILPEALVPELPRLLSEAGYDVTLQPMSEAEIADDYPAVLECVAAGGGRIQLLIYDARPSSRHEVIVAFEPAGSFRASNAMIRDVMQFLQTHGAIDPARKSA